MGNRSKDFNEFKYKQLQDPELRVVYINEALKENDPDILLSVLRDCAIAMGGISQVASKIHVSRQAVNKMFSEDGNPRWENLSKILQAFDLRINVTLAHEKAGAKKKLLSHA